MSLGAAGQRGASPHPSLYRGPGLASDGQHGERGLSVGSNASCRSLSRTLHTPRTSEAVELSASINVSALSVIFPSNSPIAAPEQPFLAGQRP